MSVEIACQRLAFFDAAHEQATRRFMRIMEMPGTDESAHLCQWLTANTDHATQIFPDMAVAEAMSNLVGTADLFDKIRYALLDGGEISFVQTSEQGPKIVLAGRHDPWFATQYARLVAPPPGGLESIPQGHAIRGFLKDAFAFTSAFDEHLAEARAVRNHEIKLISETLLSKAAISKMAASAPSAKTRKGQSKA
jgi:hypothetical protein